MSASHAERIADVAAGVSWGGFLVSELLVVDEVLRVISLVISCASGVAAIVYYWKRMRKL